jgi:hypothetical protein
MNAYCKQTATFKFYNDPGHGWIEVQASDLKALGLTPRDFSRYSYRRHNTFYLEEDCDASKFVAVYETKYGCKPEFTDVYQERTFIRALPPIW